MAPDLEDIRRAFEQATRDFTFEDWHRAPEGRWSSAQILQHLLLSYTGTTRGLHHVMQSGEPLAERPSLYHRLATFLVVGIGFIPSGRTAPRQTTPSDDPNHTDLRKFNDALVAMDASLFDAERRFGRRARVLDHPFLGPLTASQWRGFHRSHARHHLKQIQQRSRSGSGAASTVKDLV